MRLCYRMELARLPEHICLLHTISLYANDYFAKIERLFNCVERMITITLNTIYIKLSLFLNLSLTMNAMERQQFTQHLAALNCFAAVDLNLNYENAIHTLECIHNTLQTLQFINMEHLLEMRDRLDSSSSEVSPIYDPYLPRKLPEDESSQVDDASECSESVGAKIRAYDNVSNITSSHFDKDDDSMPSLLSADDSSIPSLIPADEDISQILPTEAQDYYIEVIDDSKQFVPIRPPTIIDLTNDFVKSASDWNRYYGVPSTNALDNIHYAEHYTIPPELEYGLGIESHNDKMHPNVTVRRSKRIANK